MPRTFTAPERAKSLATVVRHVLRAEVMDVDGSWQDLRDLGPSSINVLVGGSISTTVDALVWSATVRVRLGNNTEGGSPLVAASLFNRDGIGVYAPLLTPGAQIRLYVHTLGPAEAESDPTKRLMFWGRIDRSDFASDPMTLTCRDLGGILLDTIVREDRTYGDKDAPVAAATVMQQFLDDNAGLLGGVAPTLTVVGTPTYVVKKFEQVGASILDALNTLADLFGWRVRYAFNASDDFVLTLYDPLRDRVIAAGGDYTIAPTEYHAVDAASLDIQNVRNRFKGWWVDGVTGESLSLEVSDTGSIATFGDRFEQFGGDAVSNIRDGNTMLAFLQYALADQASPPFDHSVKAFFLHFVSLGDVPEFSGNAVHYDEPQQLAVVGITHDFPDSGQSESTTALACRGSPSGAYKRWLRYRGGPVFPDIPPAPILEFLKGELSQFGRPTSEVDGAVWPGYRMPAGVDEIRIHALLGIDETVPVPNIDASTLTMTIRRPDGDIGKTPEYASIECLSTRPEMWKRTVFFGVRGGLTSKPLIPKAVQAIDPTPTPVEGTIATISVVRVGSTNTVTVTPGVVDTVLTTNLLCIMRNEHILPPIYIGGSTDPVVFVDSGLEPSAGAEYVYDAFIWNNGVSGKAARTVATAPIITPPVFVNGTPIAAIVSNVQKVQLSWTGATPGAGGVRVEASVDGTTIRVVGAGALASGTIYDAQVGPKLYRLVAYSLVPATDIVTTPWTWYTGTDNPLSNPGALPRFVNGTPKVVFGSTFPTPSLTLAIEWACATPGVATIRIRRSTTGAGGTYSTVPAGISAAVASGSWKAPIDAGNASTYITTDAWYKLEAMAANGVTVVGSSAPTHWVPPA